MDRRWVSAVALYGPKTGKVRNLLESVQATIARQLGGAFLPYTLEQIHGTLIGLNGVREHATGAVISQYYLEHRGARCMMDFERVLEILEERFSRPLPIRIHGHVDVQVSRERVRIVAADSATLAPARFAGALPLTADDLARLYD